MSFPKIALVYLTYFVPDSIEDIPACFQSLEQVVYPKELWKIFMVENPSTHGASHPFIQNDWFIKMGQTLPAMSLSLNSTDQGFAGAQVVAYEQAKQWGADYIYLLNQDTVVDPFFLQTIVQYAQEHPAYGILQSRIMLKQDPEKLNSQGNALHFLGFGFSDGYQKTPQKAKQHKRPLFYASGAGMLIRMDLLNQIGSFEPSYYMYHEDVDLSWRARLAGFQIGYVEDSVIYHHYEFS